MNKFLSLGLAGLLTLGLATSCKDDVLTGGDTNQNGPNFVDDGRTVWFAGALSLPNSNGTRSATEDNGYTPGEGNNQTNSNVNGTGENIPDYELGYDYENTVRTVLLVFANKDKKFVAHSVVKGITNRPQVLVGEPITEPFELEVVGEIKYSDLKKAYYEDKENGGNNGLLFANQVVYVYAFCNYTSRMLERFEALAAGTSSETEDWYNWEGLVEEEPSPAGFTPLTQNSIWSENSFLMANAGVCEIEFPETLADWDQYADRSNPYKIGKTEKADNETWVVVPIDVERVAARIDFKDGSTKWSAFNSGSPNTYPIFVNSNGNGELGDEGDEEVEGDLNLISVQLNRMCLVNMSKNYFYLRRVSKDGTNSAAPVGIGGIETSTNFVVDYDWQKKQTVKGIDVSNESTYFNFPLYTTESQADDTGNELKYNRFGWYTDRIQEDFLKPDQSGNPTAKPETWKGSPSGGGYYIWRYVTENTIPNADQQKTVQSTGIVFKGRIIPGRDIDKDTDHKYMSEKVKTAIKTINSKTFNPETQMDDCPYLYSYNNILYGGHDELIEGANNDGNNGPLHQVVNQVLRHWVFNASYTPQGGESTENVYIYKAHPAADDDVLTVEKWENITKGNKITVKIKVVDAADGQPAKYEEKELQCNVIINQDDFLAQAPASDLTVYRPYNEDDADINGDSMGDGWGYYCYYFYWNRHNDNGKSGLMGNMEFATVRNNVYKLYVDKIAKLGHPRLRKYDPDPVDPEDPDEDPVNYIQVQVKVLPWVVRENKITFE